MNQILVTEKIYVTPELKRKKKIYKALFLISIFLIIALASVYIYAEYDKSKEESISGDILSFLDTEKDNTTISSYENALVVKISQEVKNEMNSSEVENQQQSDLKLATATSTYTASDGKKYDVYGLMVNLRDYSVGTNNGGQVSMFDDFDIDYNQQKYLMETRFSGALTVPYSAMVIEKLQQA